MDMLKTMEDFRNLKLDKIEYASKMWASHLLLFDYAKLLSDSNCTIKNIQIDRGGVFLTTNDDLKLFLDEGTSSELLSKGDVEKCESSHRNADIPKKPTEGLKK